MHRLTSLLTATLLLSLPGWSARDVTVPGACTPEVNAKLGTLIASGGTDHVDNVVACGTTTRRSRYQPAGAHGSHHVHSLLVTLPSGTKTLIEVVTNDQLDGVVTSEAHS